MFDFFLEPYREVLAAIIVLEAIAFLTGTLSVWLAKRENILVYPVGLVGTTITGFLLYRVEYFGDMVINFYYTLMSFYGWYVWGKAKKSVPLPVSRINRNEKFTGLALFVITIIVILVVYKVFDYKLRIENYFDILTSGIFFTAMYYMARKKIESWILWIIGDIIVVPLYAYRGLGMLSVQYILFTILAIQAYFEWRKNLNKKTHPESSGLR